jgi:hypothetical protein
MKATSWTVFFMLRPLTTIHTTLLTEEDDLKDEILINLAKDKINRETGISIDKLAYQLGKNDNFGEGWITVEQNDTSASEKELEVLEIHKTNMIE